MSRLAFATLAAFLSVGCNLLHQGPDSGAGSAAIEAQVEAACTTVGAFTRVTVSARPSDNQGCLLISLLPAGSGGRWSEVAISRGTSIESILHTDRSCDDALSVAGALTTEAVSASGVVELEYPPLHGRASNVSVEMALELANGRAYRIRGLVEHGGGPFCPSS